MKSLLTTIAMLGLMGSAMATTSMSIAQKNQLANDAAIKIVAQDPLQNINEVKMSILQKLNNPVSQGQCCTHVVDGKKVKGHQLSVRTGWMICAGTSC